MQKKVRVFVALSILLFASFLSAETLRDRASLHFDMVDWAVDSHIIAHVEKQGTILPGGNETFPVLAASRNTGTAAIYPEAEGLGVIDYTGTGKEQFSFLTKLEYALQKKEIDVSFCSHDRSFLSTLNVFRLKKLPEISSVLFSSPQATEDGTYSVRYRLTVQKDGKPGFVFLTVMVTGSSEAPVVADIIFDGDTYASYAEQN